MFYRCVFEKQAFCSRVGQNTSKNTSKAPPNHSKNEPPYSKFRVCFSYRNHVFHGGLFRKGPFRSRVGPFSKCFFLYFFSFCSKTGLQRRPPKHREIEEIQKRASFETVQTTHRFQTVFFSILCMKITHWKGENVGKAQ